MDEGEQAKIKGHHKRGEYGELVIIVRHYASSHAVCTLYSVSPSLNIFRSPPRTARSEC